MFSRKNGAKLYINFNLVLISCNFFNGILMFVDKISRDDSVCATENSRIVFVLASYRAGQVCVYLF